MADDKKVPKTLDDIEWTGEGSIADKKLWAKNVKVVGLLLKIGTPTKVIKTDIAKNIPITYDINGLPVEFLPHWSFYSVNSINLNVPSTEEEILQDVANISYLVQRGYKSSR